MSTRQGAKEVDAIAPFRLRFLRDRFVFPIDPAHDDAVGEYDVVLFLHRLVEPLLNS